MNTWNDVVVTAELELKHWFPKQSREEYAQFYWYYRPSTPESDGGFLICKDAPPNPDYKLAMPERISGFKTIQQNLAAFLKIAVGLPILSIK